MLYKAHCYAIDVSLLIPCVIPFVIFVSSSSFRVAIATSPCTLSAAAGSCAALKVSDRKRFLIPAPETEARQAAPYPMAAQQRPPEWGNPAFFAAFRWIAAAWPHSSIAQNR